MGKPKRKLSGKELEENNKSERPTFKVSENLINSPHKIEIELVGCGGTGSQVLQGLARMDMALESLGHPGIHVTAYDFDTVEEPNIGRQLFSHNDIGENKATCLISKINRFYGYSWISKEKKYEPEKIYACPFLITCVDNVNTRKEINAKFKKSSSNFRDSTYWMDFGNGANTGQVVMGSNRGFKHQKYYLNSIGDIGIPEQDDNDTPSCSLAEALTKQDLMINPMIANAGLSMMWNMFRTLKVEYNVVYLNLAKMKMNSTLTYSKNHESKILKNSNR